MDDGVEMPSDGAGTNLFRENDGFPTPFHPTRPDGRVGVREKVKAMGDNARVVVNDCYVARLERPSCSLGNRRPGRLGNKEWVEEVGGKFGVFESELLVEDLCPFLRLGPALPQKAHVHCEDRFGHFFPFNCPGCRRKRPEKSGAWKMPFSLTAKNRNRCLLRPLPERL